MGLALALSTEAVTVILVYATLSVALALQRPPVEAGGDGGGGGSAEALVHTVRHEEVFLAALLLELLGPVHGVVRDEEGGLQLAGRHRQHVLDPGAVGTLKRKLSSPRISASHSPRS